METTNKIDWKADRYSKELSFVYEYGKSALEWLSPKDGERVLDLGCGTGELASQISDLGAEVVGVDASKEMIESARRRFPRISFAVSAGEELAYRSEFDAVFSNAALHWMLEPQSVAERVYRSLKAGGRFVGEMGGYKNVHSVLEAFDFVGKEYNLEEVRPWYFPTLAQYAGVLENAGFTVSQIIYFHRPTVLRPSEFIEVFGDVFLNRLPVVDRESARKKLVSYLDNHLEKKENGSVLDYYRLRFVAVK